MHLPFLVDDRHPQRLALAAPGTPFHRGNFMNLRACVIGLLCSLLWIQTATADSKSQPKKPPTAAADADKKDKEKKDLPLTPTRTIEFSTDEGTWISLDISPDGKSLIFELLGDFYTMPLTGGEAKKITSGLAFNSQPRFSPDGK